jgi:hypothetical protein
MARSVRRIRHAARWLLRKPVRLRSRANRPPGDRQIAVALGGLNCRRGRECPGPGVPCPSRARRARHGRRCGPARKPGEYQRAEHGQDPPGTARAVSRPWRRLSRHPAVSPACPGRCCLSHGQPDGLNAGLRVAGRGRGNRLARGPAADGDRNSQGAGHEPGAGMPGARGRGQDSAGAVRAGPRGPGVLSQYEICRHVPRLT